MTNSKRFLTVPMLALCTLLTFSACNDDPDNGGGGSPAVAMNEASSSESGIVVPVMVLNADQVSYAILLRSTGSEARVPVAEDFKSKKVSELTKSSLVIPASEIAGFGTYDVYAYATKNKKQGPQIHSTVEYTEEKFAPELTFEVLNKTPFTLDVKVDVSAVYNTYVATVIRSSAYREVDFVASAQMSMNTEPGQVDFGVQPFLVNSASKTIPESQLAKDTKYNSTECQGLLLHRLDDKNTPIKYIAAIYAVDMFGKASIHTSAEEFELPEAAATSSPVIDIKPKTTFTTLSAEFTAVGDCAKLVYGGFAQDETKYPDDFWAENNKPAAMEFLASLQVKDAPCAYTGKPVSRKINAAAQPGRKMIVYVIGITADGKVGPVNYKLVPMQMPALDGTASISKIEAVSAAGNTLTWKITPAPGAKKYRFMVTGVNEFNSIFANDPTVFHWTMTTDESPNGYGWWSEVSAEELAKNNNQFEKMLSVPNMAYIIRGIAQDANGKWGQITAGPNQNTEPEKVVDTSIDFSKGTGAVSLSVTNQEAIVEGGYTFYNVTYSVAKGANTAEIYCVAFREAEGYASYEDFTYEKVLASCAYDFNTTTVDSMFPALTAEELGTTQVAANLSAPSSYGTCFWAFISKDNNGNFKIAAVLLPGKDPITF